MLRLLTFPLCILITYSIPLFFPIRGFFHGFRLFRTAFRDTVPMMTGYVFLGFGILALQNGLSIRWTMAMSVLIYAGSMQFAAVTMRTRFLPFLIFGEKGETPAVISHLGRVLPYAVMAMLVVYCLKGLDFSAPGSFPELLCTALVAGLHAWKRNTLLSIGVGTIAYMLLVQLVF